MRAERPPGGPHLILWASDGRFQHLHLETQQAGSAANAPHAVRGKGFETDYFGFLPQTPSASTRTNRSGSRGLWAPRTHRRASPSGNEALLPVLALSSSPSMLTPRPSLPASAHLSPPPAPSCSCSCASGRGSASAAQSGAPGTSSRFDTSERDAF